MRGGWLPLSSQKGSREEVPLSDCGWREHPEAGRAVEEHRLVEQTWLRGATERCFAPQDAAGHTEQGQPVRRWLGRSPSEGAGKGSQLLGCLLTFLYSSVPVSSAQVHHPSLIYWLEFFSFSLRFSLEHLHPVSEGLG